ncbi:BQ5605_C015g07987 [Microbotryum silenes-dioicae]|uniref:BQ5605_C015g07987 protein n=1 Tax=Microbotryum silenes-dioicae TaxID=796604 RepID=A0A2X0LY02_9BASI|nr:BQ5605_C015g07987 [Microbotryum silenes-dioicae]
MLWRGGGVTGGIVEASNTVADVVHGDLWEDKHGRGTRRPVGRQTRTKRLCYLSDTLRDETAQVLPTVQEGGSFRWIKTKTRAAQDGTLLPSGLKVFYANAQIILTVLHVLSFDMRPQWFIKANTVAREFVFQAREDGGLGLISIGDIVCSVALRVCDAVAGSDEAIWVPLARESWRSLVAATAIFSSRARVEKLYRDSTRWGPVIAAARVTVPTIKSELLTLPELLSLPPRLPSLYAEGAKHAYDDADAVAQFAQIVGLYWRDEGKGWAIKLRAKALLSKTAVRPARIPSTEAPHPRCFNFFRLTRPSLFASFVGVVRFPGKVDRLHDRFESAVEPGTHWRLMYDVTSTRKRQHTQGHASSPSWSYSASFWGRALHILLDKLGIEEADVVPSTFIQEQLTMGLPLLRGCGRITLKWMWVRLACVIGFQRLHLVRWRVHQ